MSSDAHITLAFDPDGEILPEPLSDPGREEGEVVALLADAALRESGWAARAAVALCTKWAQAGRRVLLMDANLVDPALHTALDERNDEGVTDAVLYGVSPARMARSRDEGFLFASAGTVTADASTVLRHPRWTSVLSACRAAGSRVVLFLPAGVPGAEALADEADRLIRLKTALSATSGMEPGGIVLHPPRTGRGEAPMDPTDDVLSASPAGSPFGTQDATGLSDADFGTAISPGDGETGADRADDPPSGEPHRDPPDLTEGDPPSTNPGEDPGAPPSPAAQPRSGGRRGPGILIALVALLLLVLIAALLGFIEIPGITPEAAAHTSEGVSASP